MVFTEIKTNASLEEIEEAISGYNNRVERLGNIGTFEITMAPYDNYTLLPEDANNILLANLQYEFSKQKRELEFKIIKTELS